MNNENDLIKLLDLYPDKPWGWHGLSSNPYITWEIVQSNMGICSK